MEHPHDPYHVRPFPQQPNRGSKELVTALADLELAFGESTPDLEKLRAIQIRMHESVNSCNDDRLVNMIRLLSKGIDSFQEKPEKAALQLILQQLLKIRVELKHL